MGKQHIFVVHKDCQIDYCMICEGGLALCEICGGLEGGLPSECPGEPMSTETQEKVYAGELDFVGEEWVTKASPNSPAYYRKS